MFPVQRVLRYAIGLFLWALPPVLPAQPLPDAASAETADRVRNNVESLRALLQSLQSKEREIARVQEELRAAPDEITESELLEHLGQLKNEQAELARQFERFAVSVDTSIFGEEPEKTFDWQQELGNLLKPILEELKSATAESRAIADLRSQIDALEERHDVAAKGVENLEALEAEATAPALQQRLQEEFEQCRQRRDDARNQLRALEIQLETRLAERESLLDETTSYVQNFFRTRGLNLLLGILAFCAVFFGVRFLASASQKIRPSRKEKTFTSRLGLLLTQVASVLGGLLAMLLVFNTVGDWFLLGIVVIFLLGVGWASIKTLPQYVETMKLMLNVGPVREMERLVFDGTPWLVDSLGFSAVLVNPLLDGGRQRLPVKHLVGMHSRPNGEQEEWFPCRQGDWVRLSDGTFGRVAYQTPSAVQLVELGGSQIVYQTPDFLAMAPKTLSTNFRIATTFGVDYKHQAICTTEIPERMEAHLTQGLARVVDPKLIKNVNVAFKEAAPSSLDYEIELDLDGQAAPKYRVLQRAIGRLLVEACNEHGWEIPFTQVTVHQAS